MFLQIFDDKRVITAVIGLWTVVTSCVFLGIMLEDESPFLSFGPNDRTKLMGVNLDTWGKWWCVAVYTFASTGIAAFSSDAVVPWITNTIQDHKTEFIPYSKVTCLLIIQTFTVYAVIMSVVGMFVALTQIDFMLVRITADLLVNQYTTFWFLRGKTTDPTRYKMWLEQREIKPDVVCVKCAGKAAGGAADEAVDEAADHDVAHEKRECMKLLTAPGPASAPRSDAVLAL
jgi:hypothetical protein